MNLLKSITLIVTLTVFSPTTPAVVNTGLIAYWPLNGDAQEVIQKYPSTAIAMTFTSAPRRRSRTLV